MVATRMIMVRIKKHKLVQKLSWSNKVRPQKLGSEQKSHTHSQQGGLGDRITILGKVLPILSNLEKFFLKILGVKACIKPFFNTPEAYLERAPWRLPLLDIIGLNKLILIPNLTMLIENLLMIIPWNGKNRWWKD